MREAVPVELRVPPSTVWRLTLQLVGIALVVYVLVRARSVLIWTLIALILSLALAPAVGFLRRRNLPRGAAVAVVMASIVLLIGALFGTLVPLLVDQAESLVNAIPTWGERLRDSESLAWANRRFRVADTMTEELAGATKTAASSLFAFIGGVFFVVAGIVTVVVLTAFMLLFGPQVVRRILAWVEPDRRRHVADLMRKTRDAVGGFVAGSLVIASIGGVVTGVTLLALHVPYWLALGLAMIVLGLIPYIGPIIGGALVVATAFLSSGGKAGLIALAVFIAYQQVENHLLQPLVQQRTIRMNPLLIALSMLIGTSIAGIAGALLALPVASAVQVVLKSVLARRRRRHAIAYRERLTRSERPKRGSRPVRVRMHEIPLGTT